MPQSFSSIKVPLNIMDEIRLQKIIGKNLKKLIQYKFLWIELSFYSCLALQTIANDAAKCIITIGIFLHLCQKIRIPLA